MLSNLQTVSDYVAEFVRVIRNIEKLREAPYYDRAPKNKKGEYQNVTIGDGINIDWSNHR